MQDIAAQDSHKYSCIDCKHRSLCLPDAMAVKDIREFDAIVQRTKPVLSGKHLYKDGDNFTSVFAIHSGSVKTCTVDAAGVEQVTGFYLPGEMVGFDGIGSNSHGCNVVAMETSAICRIPYRNVVELAQKIPVLQDHLFTLMSRQIATDFKIMFSLSKQNATARVATLMLDLSKRFRVRNYSAFGYRLPMSRMDIGNFLGLSLETVSRTFGMLHRAEIIRIRGRDLLIKDPAQLEKLSHTDGILPVMPHAASASDAPALVHAMAPRQQRRAAESSWQVSL